MTPTCGRIVQYVLSADDVARINQRRLPRPQDVGNYPSVGDVVPLIVVRVWPDEYGPGVLGVNGQAFLDGHDQWWITSAKEGLDAGQWHWPERA